MKEPQEALEAARKAAGDAPPGDASGEPRFDEVSVSASRLAEWALIEPERAEVYSTRRFGGAITVIKRLLIRVLDQYFREMTAQQSRFNAHIASRVLRLEERAAALEEQRVGQHRQPGDIAEK